MLAFTGNPTTATRGAGVAGIIAGLGCAAAPVALMWPQPWQTSLPALLSPLALNEAIPGVPGGFVLGDAVAGHENDVVLVARSGAQRVEVHVLDRGTWAEAVHTPSFDVAYEALGSNAPSGLCDAVRDAIASAIRANDPGGLRIDGLGRRPYEASLLERVLDRVGGGRSLLVGVFLVGASASLAEAPFGLPLLALLLAGLGVWVRAVSLDLPFPLDGDVQRLFTAHLSLSDLVRVAAFQDRHPPFMFLLLHAAEHFGQSEVVVRLPAVIAGALQGPAILAMAMWLRDDGATRAAARRLLPAVCAAVAVTLSPVLVDRSREVSELTLFGLLAVVTLGASVRACENRDRLALWVVAIGHALLLWTYYLAIFLVLGFWTAMRALGRIETRALRAAGLGGLLAIPSLALAARTLVRDYPLRQTARVLPQFVWGERSLAEMASEIADTVMNAYGGPFVLVALTITGVPLLRRERAVLAPIAGAAAVAGGMLLLVQAARIQTYYIVCALPLLALGLALFDLPQSLWLRLAVLLLIGLATASGTPGGLARNADRIYGASAATFGRRFAQLISDRPESRIALDFAPDGVLLVYNLARLAGVEVDWGSLQERSRATDIVGLRQQLVPLVPQPWAVGEHTGRDATAVLDELVHAGAFLAVVRNPSPLPDVDAWLVRCTALDRTTARRLLLCSPAPR